MPNTVVASIPKAGTFFMMTVLENLNYNVQPYQLLQRGIVLDWEKNKKLKFRSLNNVTLCTHIAPTVYLHDHKIIFMYRDLKECCISLGKWCQETKQWGLIPKHLSGYELTEFILAKHIDRYAHMVKRAMTWFEQQDACLINYNNPDYDALALHLNVSITDVLKAAELAGRMDTRTRSKVRSYVNDDTWSPKCEKLFNEYLGGCHDKMVKTYCTI